MSLRQIDFTKVINDEQVYEHVMANYDQLGKDSLKEIKPFKPIITRLEKSEFKGNYAKICI